MQKKNLNILIPILSFGKAGGIRALSQLANNWSQLGANVTLVVFSESEDPYYPVDADITWIDKNGERVDKNKKIYKNKNSGIKKIIAIYKYLRNHSGQFDVILANSNLTAWPVWLGSKSINYYYIQAYEVEFSSKRNVKSLIKKTAAYSTYFLPLRRVVNAELYKNYKNLHAKNVIPPGLDLTLYYPKKNDYTNKREFIVGCIGRVEEWKGSSDVTEAVRILHEKGYNIKFKVAFNPVNYNSYELVKPDGDENLSQFYRDLDVLVAPGHIQLGAVHYPVIEAMACKTPVITTGYYPADNDNAYIVPIKRPDIIANTLGYIIDNYDEAIRKAEIAYENIKQFDWKVVSSKFLEIFENELRED